MVRSQLRYSRTPFQVLRDNFPNESTVPVADIDAFLDEGTYYLSWVMSSVAERLNLKVPTAYADRPREILSASGHPIKVKGHAYAYLADFAAACSSTSLSSRTCPAFLLSFLVTTQT